MFLGLLVVAMSRLSFCLFAFCACLVVVCGLSEFIICVAVWRCVLLQPKH